MANIPRDPNTLSNYHLFRTVHTTINYSIDFDKRIIAGSVLLRLRCLAGESNSEIHLDTSHLQVDDVQVDGKKNNWELLPRSEPYGSQLKVLFDTGLAEGQTVDVNVRVLQSFDHPCDG